MTVPGQNGSRARRVGERRARTRDVNCGPSLARFGVALSFFASTGAMVSNIPLRLANPGKG